LTRLDTFEGYFKSKEPLVHAFLPERDRFKRLRAEAKQLVRKFSRPEKRPALFGLLVGVKDMFHVDGFPTQAGSRLPARALRGPQAASVTLLKKAGALIAGKTETTEFAYFTPGPTRNPHNTEHTPGGSSSGSAAATAAGLVDIALGTQTIGSIIRPASFCGVAGFKPSYGRIPTEGVIPLAHSLDHVGVFAQGVGLINRAASVLCTNWKMSAVSSNKPYLAVPTGGYLHHASAEMREKFENTLETLREAGYRVKELDAMPDFENVVARHNTILAAEAAETQAIWFEQYRHLYSERMAALIEKGLAVSPAQLQAALADAQSFGRGLRTLMDIHGIDLWVSPAAVGAAPKGLAITGDPVMNLPWTQAGLPTLGIPTSWSTDALPLGTQFIADFNRDEDLLAWSAEIERILAEAR
jgi:Asp-tRNA(Asn)/Glu-tRNA(Gln) amidotransferase A subunit family amidase